MEHVPCTGRVSAAILGLLLTGTPNATRALSCSHPTPEAQADHYENADAVFIGRVVGERRLSPEERWHHHGVVRTVTFDVVRRRKGRFPDQLTLGFMEIPNTLPDGFEAGVVLEVFAWQTEGFLFTTTCGSSRRLPPELTATPVRAGCSSCAIETARTRPRRAWWVLLAIPMATRRRRRD